ncbi:MAG: hypothetical protein ABR964_00750 [Tepidisphaeraceae bacterium]
MRTLLCALMAMLAVGLVAKFTVADEQKDAAAKQSITGILIDQHCGEMMMSKDDPEAAAADHPKSCCTAEACAASGYSVISGKQMLKFDDNGNKLAKDFLAKTDMEKNLRVTVEGTVTDDKIAVTSLTAAPPTTQP